MRVAAPTSPHRQWRHSDDRPIALRSFREALRIREGGLGTAQPEIAVILNNLAVLHENQARTDGAAACRDRRC